MDMMCVPWLEKLFAISTFYTACEVHPNEPKNECNKFCLDCKGNPLCISCIKFCHQDHRVIQIMRSAYHDVVKTTDIYKYLDILGVQTYVNKSFTVVFINKRPQYQSKKKKIGKFYYNRDSICKICKRNLMDISYFCSLACKFEYIKKNGGFLESAKEMEEMKRLLEESIKPKEKAKKSRQQNQKRKVDEAGIIDEENEDSEEDEKEVEEGDKESVLPVNRPSTSLRKSDLRRKGMPHRAPFF